MSSVHWAALVATLFLGACSTPGERLSKGIASLEEEVRTAVTQADEVQWNALMDLRDELAEELEVKRADMTESQIEACNQALGAISGHEMKRALNSFGDGLQDAMQQAESMMKVLQQDAGEMIADTLQ
jgi:flagellar hook-associated protein FlgK